MKHYIWLTLTLAVVAAMAGAGAQTTRQRPEARSLTASELENFAAARTVEQIILRAAAERLRHEKTGARQVQLQVTVSHTATINCYAICAGPNNTDPCANICRLGQ